ncbi:hypothetical protein DFJ77DRAFT_450598 [Powellomyces hirtus]|nr:hypothetical protein DFJ77DRAFT_450598 [Powellomyces hirtus]
MWPRWTPSGLRYVKREDLPATIINDETPASAPAPTSASLDSTTSSIPQSVDSEALSIPQLQSPPTTTISLPTTDKSTASAEMNGVPPIVVQEQLESDEDNHQEHDAEYWLRKGASPVQPHKIISPRKSRIFSRETRTPTPPPHITTSATYQDQVMSIHELDSSLQEHELEHEQQPQQSPAIKSVSPSPSKYKPRSGRSPARSHWQAQQDVGAVSADVMRPVERRRSQVWNDEMHVRSAMEAVEEYKVVIKEPASANETRQRDNVHSSPTISSAPQQPDVGSAATPARPAVPDGEKSTPATDRAKRRSAARRTSRSSSSSAHYASDHGDEFERDVAALRASPRKVVEGHSDASPRETTENRSSATASVSPSTSPIALAAEAIRPVALPIGQPWSGGVEPSASSLSGSPIIGRRSSPLRNETGDRSGRPGRANARPGSYTESPLRPQVAAATQPWSPSSPLPPLPSGAQSHLAPSSNTEIPQLYMNTSDFLRREMTFPSASTANGNGLPADYTKFAHLMTPMRPAPSSHLPFDAKAMAEFDPLVPVPNDWFMRFETPEAAQAALAVFSPAQQQSPVPYRVPSSGVSHVSRSASGSSYSNQTISLLDSAIECPTPRSIMKYSERDMEQLTQRLHSKAEAAMADLQKKLEADFECRHKQLEAEFAIVETEYQAQLEAERKVAAEESKIALQDYEERQRKLIEDHGLERDRNTMEYDRLFEQLEQTYDDKTRLGKEIDVLDVKNKQLRLDLADMRRSSGKLTSQIDGLNEDLRLAEERYRKLKGFADNKLEEANATITRIQGEHEIEISTMNAKHLRLEMKLRTLERSLDSKDQEIASLSQICDSLVQQLEGGH